MKKHSFYIAGGDLRSAYLAQSLGREGGCSAAFGLSGAGKFLNEVKESKDVSDAKNYDVIILPLPCCDKEGFIKAPLSDEKTELAALLNSLEHGSVLMGGMVPAWAEDVAKSRGIELYDYYEREEFAVRNAALTSEAAVALAMDMLNESISGMPVLILGHGRIGRLLASVLKADADVTVAARRFSDLAWIRSEGLTPTEFIRLNEKLPKFRLVFNTVPAMVLDEEKLRAYG